MAEYNLPDFSREELEQKAGIYRNLSRFSSQTTTEGDWITLQEVRIGNLSIPILRVNTQDVVEVPGLPLLPRQVLAGDSPAGLKRFPTFFIQDGFPGLDYMSHFYVRDGKIGYINGRQSGNTRPPLAPVREAGILCEEFPNRY